MDSEPGPGSVVVNRPVISIVGCANKVHYWGRFYESLTKNVTPWELVFVGDREPLFKLPENFRVFHSDACPMRNVEIAARLARGRFLLVVVDDAILNPMAVEWAYRWLQKLPRFSVVGFRYFRDGVERNDQLTLVPNDPKSPLAIYTGIVAKKDWMDVGGVDRRYVGNHGVEDLFMRCVARGGHAFLSPESITNEIDQEPNPNRKSHLYLEDTVLFHGQWTDQGGLYRQQPRTPVQSFGPEIMEGVICTT